MPSKLFYQSGNNGCGSLGRVDRPPRTCFSWKRESMVLYRLLQMHPNLMRAARNALGEWLSMQEENTMDETMRAEERDEGEPSHQQQFVQQAPVRTHAHTCPPSKHTTFSRDILRRRT